MMGIKLCPILFLVLFVIVDGAIDTKVICNKTSYPDLCTQTLPNNVGYQELYKLSVQVAMEELTKASNGLQQLQKNSNFAKSASRALELCHELFSIALTRLNDSSTLTFKKPAHEALADLNVWLTAAGTHQQGCIDAVSAVRDDTLRRTFSKRVKKSRKLTVNSLTVLQAYEESIARSLPDFDDTPRWMGSLDAGAGADKPDIVVAKDGSGKFKTIGDALKAVPDSSPKRFVIYVKKGIYAETIRVDAAKTNVMMYGDGMDDTIVTGNRNAAEEGTDTFNSATFLVMADDFIAKNMGFRNTAGPARKQAVALLANGDKGVFYLCKFEGFQDTLCANSFRQFFRQCTISGTVDFIFGQAAAVFQNCNILLRRPIRGQQNIITAQGKSHASEKSGFTIQDCTISPSGNLAGAQTFLGRPWFEYSTTIFIHTTMGHAIDPKGYIPFRGATAPPTIYYAEFENSGPGAVTANRVKWTGLHVRISRADATKFTLNTFLQGATWIPKTGVPFKPSL